VERTDRQYNFAEEVLKSREAKKNQVGTLTTKTKTYQYDHTGRKTSYQLELGNISNETIANYEYDEIGRMKRKVLLPNGTFTTAGPKDYIIRPNPDGSVNQSNQQDIAKKAVILAPDLLIDAQTIGSYLAQIDPNAARGTPINGLQKIDYQYHIRGALRGINLDNSQNSIPNSGEGDLFSYKLDYETTGWFDGNIGKQSWHNGAAERNYTFTYDNAKRLKSATYTGINGENYSIPNMNYDRNGNITNLQRNGKTGSGFGQIDNLSYSYNGNRLSQITDAIAGNNTVDFVPRSSGDYTYYNDGSLKSDANEQIQNIVYDSFLGQPTQLQLTDGRTINHYYDGSGKLLKTVYSTGEIWEYADGFIYKNGVLYQVQDDEGRILYQNGVFNYEFHYTDHLGNTRLSFRNNNGQLEKVAETAFDPWGVILKDLGQQNATQNRWEFQGKEKETTFGLNRINLGARTVNPTTGIMDRIDPLADDPRQLRHSPYAAFWSNPVMYTDPDGRCPKCEELVKSPTDGQIFKTTGATYTYGGGQWTRNGGQLNEVVIRPEGAYGSPIVAYTTQTKGVIAGYSAGYNGTGEYGTADVNVTGFRAEYNNNMGTGDANLALDGGVKVTGFQSTASLRGGTENNNFGLGAEGNALLAEAKGTIGKLTGENNRRGYYVGGEAGVYALKGEVNPSITILGYKLGVVIGGSLGSANIGAGLGGYRDTGKGTYNLNGFISGSFIAGGKLGFEFVTPSYDRHKKKN